MERIRIKWRLANYFFRVVIMSGLALLLAQDWREAQAQSETMRVTEQPLPVPALVPGPGGRRVLIPSDGGAGVAAAARRPMPQLMTGPDGRAIPRPSDDGAGKEATARRPTPQLMTGPGGRAVPRLSDDGGKIEGAAGRPMPQLMTGPDGRTVPKPSDGGAGIETAAKRLQAPPPRLLPGDVPATSQPMQ